MVFVKVSPASFSQNNANYNLSHLILLAKEWNLDVRDLFPSKKY
ncbi:hypothetical protein Sulku_1701 [Sulfuricurvum kujiense DSM 16994]|uniref:Uncharacterized protein n=1 Tax=Sulfuricurvum kujiense (strain ATCC BAA-921 / DSM 16994 / JCM 11577 / YK-1) TaxID=709032 RepID=E4U0W0_SULKY|nr:hypothetical protein [Sulfuricurvum kujiense]ADR34362.1 hypothetical protein Sulku_1701 [Sulfuricurvum kujiense DSM 16994]